GVSWGKRSKKSLTAAGPPKEAPKDQTCVSTSGRVGLIDAGSVSGESATGSACAAKAAAGLGNPTKSETFINKRLTQRLCSMEPWVGAGPSEYNTGTVTLSH